LAGGLVREAGKKYEHAHGRRAVEEEDERGDGRRTRGGSHEQHVEAGRHSHKNREGKDGSLQHAVARPCSTRSSA